MLTNSSRAATSRMVMPSQLHQNTANWFVKHPVGLYHEVGVPTVGFSSLNIFLINVWALPVNGNKF
jgi:hypothetical protein